MSHNRNDRNREREDRQVSESVRAGMMMIVFGFCVLTFLVAIGHPEWFHLRPVSATAVAMAQASDAGVTLAEELR